MIQSILHSLCKIPYSFLGRSNRTVIPYSFFPTILISLTMFFHYCEIISFFKSKYLSCNCNQGCLAIQYHIPNVNSILFSKSLYCAFRIYSPLFSQPFPPAILSVENFPLFLIFTNSFHIL